MRESRGDGRETGSVFHHLGQHVLGQRQDHGAGPPLLRHMPGVGHELGDPLRLIDLGDPLGELAVHAAVVDFLEGLALHHAAPDLPDEQDGGDGILLGDVDPRAGVGRTWTARDEADARLAGQTRVGVGHHRGPALLPADHEPEFRVRGHGVERGEIALPRHAEGGVRAQLNQAVDQDLAAAAHRLVSSSRMAFMGPEKGTRIVPAARRGGKPPSALFSLPERGGRPNVGRGP